MKHPPPGFFHDDIAGTIDLRDSSTLDRLLTSVAYKNAKMIRATQQVLDANHAHREETARLLEENQRLREVTLEVLKENQLHRQALENHTAVVDKGGRRATWVAVGSLLVALAALAPAVVPLFVATPLF